MKYPELAPNDTRADQHALRVAAAVQNAVRPATVILFGSRATGNHFESSDIDLLVISAGSNTRATELIARRTALDYMKANPPELNSDVITMTGEEFRRYRLANQHIAGQAANHGVVMSGEELRYGADYDDEYPAHWPETKQRLENAQEYQFHFNDMVVGNSGNQKLMGFVAQQAVENALKGWLSTFNEKRTYGHELRPLWDEVRQLENWTTPGLQELERVIDALFNYTEFEDPQAPGITMDWLSKYAVDYRYGRPSYRMTRDERSELKQLINDALNGIFERINQRSGTSLDDLWAGGAKPWEQD